MKKAGGVGRQGRRSNPLSKVIRSARASASVPICSLFECIWGPPFFFGLHNGDFFPAFFADFAASVYHGRIYEWWYRYCYLQELDLLSINLEILEKKNNDGGLTISNEINFIPCSAKLEHDYAIRVKQLNLDVEAYVYWESIRDATQSSGGIFDAAPFSIRGNMTDQNGAFALGYFGVYREANEDVFFNNSELALCDLQYPEACGGDHSLDVDPCLDCEKAEGESNSKDKPFWWR